MFRGGNRTGCHGAYTVRRLDIPLESTRSVFSCADGQRVCWAKDDSPLTVNQLMGLTGLSGQPSEAAPTGFVSVL